MSLPKIRIVIADDYLLLRTAWKLLLQSNTAFEVVGLCGDGASTVEFIKNNKVDIVLMEINMPGLSCIEVTQMIGNIAPWIKIIGLSLYNEFHYINKLIKAGAKGFVTKSAGKEELFKAIEDVYNNIPFVSPSISHLLIKNYSAIGTSIETGELTMRELDVIKNIISGRTSKEIGELMCISTKTVESHKYNIFKKLNVNNSVSLTKMVIEQGIIVSEQK